MQVDAITLTAVLVVEDDPPMQIRMQRLLRDAAGTAARIDIAGDLAAARALLDAGHAYTCALVDVQLPDGNGVEFIAWLRMRHADLPAVVVSSWAAEDTILAALREGALGYLLKSAEDIELAMHLRSLQRGGAPIDPVIARRILQLLPQASQPATTTPAEGVPALTGREYEILASVARGLSNREIADATGLSRLTIETHTRNIYRKLDVRSRTEAVHVARERGLLQ